LTLRGAEVRPTQGSEALRGTHAATICLPTRPYSFALAMSALPWRHGGCEATAKRTSSGRALLFAIFADLRPISTTREARKSRTAAGVRRAAHERALEWPRAKLAAPLRNDAMQRSPRTDNVLMLRPQ